MPETKSVLTNIKGSKPHFYSSLLLIFSLVCLLPAIFTFIIVVTEWLRFDNLFWFLLSLVGAALLMLASLIGMILTFISWIKNKERKLSEYLFLFHLILFLTPWGLGYSLFYINDAKRIAEAKQHYESLNLDQKLAYQLIHWGTTHAKQPFGKEEDIQRLIRQGANIDALNATGNSPLCTAALQGYRPGLVKYILEHGANRHQYCQEGMMAIHLAASSCNTSVMEVLAKYNPDFTVRTKNDASPFDLILGSAKMRSYNCIHTALALGQHGVDITQQDAEGNTILHLVASRTSKHFLQLLIEAGINPLTRNKQGLTALAVVKQHYQENNYSQDHPVIRYLEEQQRLQQE